MINSFDTEVALDVGINAAIIYKNIQYWCEKNRTNGQNEHDGYFWTYNSISAFCEQFPYLTKRQVEVALNTLEDKGYIKSANYNKVAYDRTKWYADLKCEMQCIENVKCISHTGEMEFTSMGNGFHSDVKPIPDIKPNNNTNNLYIEKESKPKKSRFIPPTVEEVSAYCRERGNSVDPQRFVDYYSSKGWMIGKNKMVDWKASVRTWERKEKENPSPRQNSTPENPFTQWRKEHGYA